ncbi:MAG: Gfo/Idh/MocA family oxidoreductase [Bacteroidetes bacterium]|nr:Gfo/Idh/MocA family oxidoreductase [Bacteroidota bacterium]
MEKLKIGIIGAGAIVETTHLPAILSLPETGVAWVYDKNETRSSMLSSMYGIPALTGASPDKALKDVDVCLLATPYGVRKPYIDRCRELGKALVIEKPFAFSEQEHKAYCQGFKEWAIAVNFQRRFYRSVAILNGIMQTRPFGRLRSLRFVQGNFTLKGGSGFISNVGLAGGGVIAESASHILDIMLFITGASKVRVTQKKCLHVAGLDYDTEFDSEFTTPDGLIPVSCAISTLRNLDNGLYLDFENALVSCDVSPDGAVFVRDRQSGRVELELQGEALAGNVASQPPAGSAGLQARRINEAFFIFWQQFAEGMLKQKPNATSAYSCLLTSAWLEGVYSTLK